MDILVTGGAGNMFHPGWNWLSVMYGIRMWWKMSFPGIISLQSSIPSVEIKSDTGLRLCRRYRIGYCTGIPPHRIPHNQRIDRNWNKHQRPDPFLRTGHRTQGRSPIRPAPETFSALSWAMKNCNTPAHETRNDIGTRHSSHLHLVQASDVEVTQRFYITPSVL